MGSSNDTWSTRQLTEFLAVVSSVPEAATAAREAIERAAEALEGDVGAVVQRGVVTASVGFPPDAVPVTELAAIGAGALRAAELPGLGPCTTVTAKLDGDEHGWLVVGRLGDEPFEPADASVLRGMSRVLTLTLRMLALLAEERALRVESQRQADDNARLLASVTEQRLLLEQLAVLQRTIGERAPLQRVLDAVADGARALARADVVALRLIDANDPSQTVTVSTRGIETDGGPLPRMPVDRGAAGRAMSENRAVAIDDYAAVPDAMPDFLRAGVHAALAAPMHEHGTVAGGLVVASTDPNRRFEDGDRELLAAYAEHASLALAAARSVDTMRHAFNDPLTGLANRALLLERLDAALERGSRGGSEPSVLFIDLDRFKLVNDSLGHAAGDTLLVAAAERIRSVVGAGETAARLGGDEFAVLLEGPDARAEALAARILETFTPPFRIGDREVFVTASVGIASGTGSAHDVLRDADVAMYRAKAAGRNRSAVFEAGMRAALVERVELEADLQHAVERDELFLHFQPIVDIATERTVGVEALVRWAHPERGTVPPGAFIEIAEETGLIRPIGAWVLREACREVAAWQAELPGEQPLLVSVNVSGRQLADPQLPALVREVLAETRLKPGTLILELTETVLMHDTEASIAQLCALADAGAQIAVDDFGTGYSSLRYLQRFPIDILKIAKPFVDGLAEEIDEPLMARAVNDLSRTLGLGTIAEGIETRHQLERLRELGCPLGQGFLFSKPLPGDVMAAALFEAAALEQSSGVVAGADRARI